MALTNKERALAGVGISVAAGCKPCTETVVEQARKAGATVVEIKQSMMDGINVNRSGTDNIEAFAMRLIGEDWGGSDLAYQPGAFERMRMIVCLGASYVVNDVSNLQAHLREAELANLSSEEVVSVLELADIVRGKAASQVEALAGIEKESIPCPQPSV